MADAALKQAFKKLSPHVQGDIQDGQHVSLDNSYIPISMYLILNPAVSTYVKASALSVAESSCTIHLFDKSGRQIALKHNCFAKDGEIMIGRGHCPKLRQKSSNSWFFRFRLF